MAEIKAKTILTKSKLPEADYCINPYVGCSHGCHYCYARFMKRFTEHINDEWGKFVDAKINAPEVLSRELGRNPKKGTALIGSVTDAYQPAEAKFKLTRRILEALLRYDFPVSILTKSDLVLRDLDLLAQFSECEVGLTITALDDKVRRIFEPRTSSPKKRIEALQKLHETGIKTYTFIGPILPGLTDVEAIILAVKGKVDFVMAESLNARCGNWDAILALIASNYPELSALYQKGLTMEYWDEVELKVKKLCRKHQVPLKGFYRH